MLLKLFCVRTIVIKKEKIRKSMLCGKKTE